MAKTKGAYTHNLGSKQSLKQIKELAAMGMTLEEICRILGCGLRTLNERKRIDEAINSAWLQGKAIAKKELLEKVNDIAKNDSHDGTQLSALKYSLNINHGVRETQAVEHAGKDGGPIKVDYDLAKVPTSELQLLKEILQKAKKENEQPLPTQPES